jgi:hypothetical protein
MKKKAGIFLMVWPIILVVSSFSFPFDGQSRPKLDCQKMALSYAKALEETDYRSVVQLMGKELIRARIEVLRDGGQDE